MFIAFAEVKNDILAQSGISWYVIISQDEKKLYSRLNNAVRGVSIIAFILLIFISWAGFALGSRLVGPLAEFRQGISRAKNGNLDYKLKINGPQEIKDLASSFNEMEDVLKTEISDTKSLQIDLQKKSHEIKNISFLNEKLISLLNSYQSTAPDTNILLSVAKLVMGMENLKTEVVDVKGLIKKAIFMFEPKIKEKGLNLKINTPKADLSIIANPGLLTEVLNNIILNAIKFTEKGSIEVSVKDIGKDVEFSITDTGIGIPEQNLSKIFDAGKGMGLYLAKAIIEKHKGQISAQNLPQEKRTSFIFTIPKTI